MDEEQELTRFLDTLSEEHERLMERFRYETKSQAFAHWCVQQITPSLTDREISRASSMGGPGDRGIDAAWFDKTMLDPREGVRGVFFVAQAKCSEDFSTLETFGPQAGKDLRAAMSWLRSARESKARGPLQDVKNQFSEYVFDSGYPARFAVLVAGLPTAGLKELLDDLNDELRAEGDPKIRFELFDLPRLYGLYITRLETVDMAIPAEVKFKVLSQTHPHREAGVEGVVVDVPLNEISGLVAMHRLALFAKNLRVPIYGSRYNKGIEQTLEDGPERSNFWFYNNGLTAVCDDFSVNSEADDPLELTTVVAQGFQIVNGCQTCWSVYNVASRWTNLKKPLDPLKQASVLMRIIKAPPKDVRFPSKVARFTNSQTPVTPRALHANDPEQGKLKEVLAKDWKYFWETKPGEFRRRCEMDRSFRDNFEYPFSFDNEEAAQAFTAFWLQEPAFARSNKVQLFSDEQRYDGIFSFDIPAEALLVPTQLWWLLDEWRRLKGYAKRGGRRISRAEAIRHGDLYVLALLGSSLLSSWSATKPQLVDRLALHAGSENLQELLLDYPERPSKQRIFLLLKELEAAFKGALDVLYSFVENECAKDEELTVRNLLVRPTSWKKLEKKAGSRIKSLAKSLRLRLETT